MGALLDAASLGYNPAVAKPVAVLGHSQGVLAVHMVQAIVEAGSIEAASAQIDEILAIATLIGVAGTRQARQLGLAARHGEATPMLSVKDITRAQVDALIKRVSGARGPIAVAVTNSATHYVLSGYPEDLAAFGVEVAKEHKHQAKLREEKVRGGRVFEPVLEYLDVTLPFHSPLMAEAVSQAVSWAESCGINADHARELAAEVLLNHVDCVSVTNISVQEVQSFFGQFGRNGRGQMQLQETTSCGSGVIIHSDDSYLYMVTNYHVVEGATTLSVTFVDDQTYEAQLCGYDESMDIALLKVPVGSLSSDTLSQISVVTIGDSEELVVGEQVVAIGNALGYGQSVTTGIVSALNRTISTDTGASAYIQTDAAINPGNSGGALFNMNGELVGINTAKVSSTDVEGMGYAIPISQVLELIESMMNGYQV